MQIEILKRDKLDYVKSKFDTDQFLTACINKHGAIAIKDKL